MNRQIYDTHMYLLYLFDNLDWGINSFKGFINISEAMQPFLFMASHVVLHTNPAIKVAHVMSRLTYARWCACPTDYMNKLCLFMLKITGKSDKTLIALNVQYNIAPEPPFISNNVFNQV